MEGSSIALSWGLSGVLFIAACYYYWPRDHRKPDTQRRDAQPAGRKGRSDNDLARPVSSDKVEKSGVQGTKKRKAPTKKAAHVEAAVAPAMVAANEPEEIDMSTRQFAEQMARARQGADLTSGKSKESRVKTVKQSSAVDNPVHSTGSSQPGAEAEDDLSSTSLPTYNAAGDVSDMLEPVPSGPSTLRVTAPSKQQKEKAAKQSKQEEVETKKQRQNRQKVEERRLQREADERERKVMEERQRKAAREARGEPAKNGIPVSTLPVNSAWTQTKAMQVNGASAPPNGNENQSAPLLDTFDAESNSSSNGGMATSTTATSTSSGGTQQGDHDLPSEEEQLAQAMSRSQDESGWTTVAQPKKSKKRAPSDETIEPVPVLTSKTNGTASKLESNGKPKGFQSLDVEYGQRTDADPNDASNWDA